MNTIPKITHPLGLYWEQPSTKDILIDGVHALMTKHTFDKLLTYSCSTPSGVYEGKMWKRREPYMDNKEEKYMWYLCWFSESSIQTHCQINTRVILLVKDA